MAFTKTTLCLVLNFNVLLSLAAWPAYFTVVWPLTWSKSQMSSLRMRMHSTLWRDTEACSKYSQKLGIEANMTQTLSYDSWYNSWKCKQHSAHTKYKNNWSPCRLTSVFPRGECRKWSATWTGRIFSRRILLSAPVVSTCSFSTRKFWSHTSPIFQTTSL